MISKKNLPILFTGLLWISQLAAVCQVLPTTKTFIPEDTVRTVEILPGVRKLEYRKIDSITEIQILTGNVRLKQGTSLFECDSCVITKRLNLFEAFGNVHINDSDTANVYADHLRYLTDKRMAYLNNNVRLTDGKGILTTRYLEYDVNTKVGIYKKGGKVINKTTVLTSEEGYYYADLKDIYFKKNVKLKDPKYELETDSLLYNTESETARFIAETFIKDSSNRTIRTREGYYNQQTGKAEFGQRPVVQDGAIQATGDKMFIDDSTGITQIIGRAILVDTAADRTVFGGEIFFNNKTESFLATRKPLMIIKQENDSVFIAADTLFSAKLTDLYSPKDTLVKKDTLKIGKAKTPVKTLNKNSQPTNDSLNVGKDETAISIFKKDSLSTNDSLNVDKNETAIRTLNKDSLSTLNNMKGKKMIDTNSKDSSNRYFEAYRNVRIFTDSLQAVCDSMFYSFKDSVFRLYDDPVVWSKESQITGDTILLHTKNKKADRMEVFKNSFIASLVKPEIFNQVQSVRMDAYFKEGTIDSVRAKDHAESVYYIQDEDSAFTGINQSTSELMDIFFREKELHRVVFRSKVKGTIWPMQQKTPQEMRLEKFKWLENRRPKTKYELFE
jgi:lipopolysaccharide export system protein LptA